MSIDWNVTTESFMNFMKSLEPILSGWGGQILKFPNGKLKRKRSVKRKKEEKKKKEKINNNMKKRKEWKKRKEKKRKVSRI